MTASPVPDLADVLAARRSVIAASAGNHGQSVAYAADLFGVRAVVCVPEQANPVKIESMQALGAEVVCRASGQSRAARRHEFMHGA